MTDEASRSLSRLFARLYAAPRWTLEREFGLDGPRMQMYAGLADAATDEEQLQLRRQQCELIAPLLAEKPSRQTAGGRQQ